MATKSQLEDIIEVYQSQIKTLEGIVADLRSDKETINLQLERLQDALVNIRAPEAYRDHRMDRMGEDPDAMSPEEKARQKKTLEIEQGWVRGVEEPLFSSGEDLENLLGPVILTSINQDAASLHGNDES